MPVFVRQTISDDYNLKNLVFLYKQSFVLQKDGIKVLFFLLFFLTHYLKQKLKKKKKKNPTENFVELASITKIFI